MDAELATSQSPPFEIEQLGPASRFPSRYVGFGAFHVDLHKQRLLKDGSPVKLQGKVFEALLVLIENPGAVVTRETLRARLWPLSQVNYDANVNTAINKLRQALGDSTNEPNFVVTVPKKGYSFIGKLEHLHGCPAEAHGLPHLVAEREAAKPATPALHPAQASLLFATGVIALLVAGMLFGAAVVLYFQRSH